MNNYWARCNKNYVLITIRESKRRWEIHNLDEWNEWLSTEYKPDDNSFFMSSSSLDFPLEYTNNYKVIQVCDAIRGNSVADSISKLERAVQDKIHDATK